VRHRQNARGSPRAAAGYPGQILLGDWAPAPPSRAPSASDQTDERRLLKPADRRRGNFRSSRPFRSLLLLKLQSRGGKVALLSPGTGDCPV
jgi:hypothetical protein